MDHEPLHFDKRPPSFVAEDGRVRYAFVTFLMINDGFLPGAVLQAHSLRAMGTQADIVCMVTEDISGVTIGVLELIFDHVVSIPKIYLKHRKASKQPSLSYMFTRLNCLRFASGGGLGLNYEKVVVLDADVLPLKNFDHLFCVAPPAGILNEKKGHLVQTDANNKQVVTGEMLEAQEWIWHDRYRDICPHGQPIPKAITDRVDTHPPNMGINGSLFVLSPSREEYEGIMEDIANPTIRRRVTQEFDWPDMQYLTLKWSGRWQNIDVRFSSLNGYPTLDILFGTHFAGLKPWNFNNKSIRHYAKYEDFRLWHSSFLNMLEAEDALAGFKRFDKLKQHILSLNT